MKEKAKNQVYDTEFETETEWCYRKKRDTMYQVLR